MSLTVTVKSDSLSSVLAKLYAKTNDLSPVMSALGMEMENRVKERFESQTDPLGVPWSPWKPSTEKTYPKDGNRRLLDRFGDMLEHISHEHDASSATVGFKEGYATFHEFGTKKMARRGMLFADPESGTLAPDDERALTDVIFDILNAAAK
ncbi:phage virion morphogenesis protein [Propionivibrio limicola]|uniref:phage virion morphogenesis protein n=1 Tax=Propionivibrio limicola TaxID=167645 RepID=UPI0012917332|nr:phage virion morphogenesis protein [Propionivibrio limicola]